MSLLTERLTSRYHRDLETLRRQGARPEIIDTGGGSAAILINHPAGHTMLATNSWDGSLASTDHDRAHWYIGIYDNDTQITGLSGPDLEQLYLTATTAPTTTP